MPDESFVPICLWSGPRNVSTALMYSFRQRPDTVVVDEPLYGHYLRVTDAPHPGGREVLDAMDLDGDRVMRELLTGAHERPVLFMKQMAHHLVAIDHGFLKQTVNVLLVRDPVEMLPSLTVQLPEAGLADTGLATQVQLLEELEAYGQAPAVIDSRELLMNPGTVLNRLCMHLRIPFYDGMLAWTPGPIPEDGVWARHWYHNVHKSTGFQPYRPKTEPFPDRLRPLLEECLPFYERLTRSAITA